MNTFFVVVQWVNFFLHDSDLYRVHPSPTYKWFTNWHTQTHTICVKLYDGRCIMAQWCSWANLMPRGAPLGVPPSPKDATPMPAASPKAFWEPESPNVTSLALRRPKIISSKSDDFQPSQGWGCCAWLLWLSEDLWRPLPFEKVEKEGGPVSGVAKGVQPRVGSNFATSTQLVCPPLTSPEVPH